METNYFFLSERDNIGKQIVDLFSIYVDGAITEIISNPKGIDVTYKTKDNVKLHATFMLKGIY